MLISLAVVALVVVAFIIISMLSDRITSKMSFRNIFRRRANTLLVIAGSMIGTALIVGSLAMNDSFERFIYSQIRQNLGEIDQVVVTSAESERGYRALFSLDELQPLIDLLEAENLTDGIMPVLAREVTAGKEGNARSLDRSLSTSAAIVGVEFEKLRDFGSEGNTFPEFNSSNAQDLPGAIITRELSETLQIEVGDTLEILIDEAERLLFWIQLPRIVVTGIADHEDLIGYSGLRQGMGDSRIFMTPEDARHVMKIGMPDSYNELLISNRGDYLSGAELTDRVVSLFGETGLEEEFRMVPIKQQQVRMATQGNVGLLFFALSAFAIFAGVLLLSNIYFMLAEERRTELGTLRALGYTRKRVARAILYEGFFYSIIASAVGIGVGIIITRQILGGFVDLVADISMLLPVDNAAMVFSAFERTFVFFIKPESVFLGFFLGLLIPLAIVSFSGKRISMMNIVCAVRGIPEELGKKPRRLLRFFQYLLLGIAAILCYSGIVGQSGAVLLSGLTMGLLLFPLSFPFKRRRLIETICSIAVILLIMFSNQIPFVAEQSGESIPLMIVKGFAILFSGLLLVVYNLKTFDSIFSLIMKNGNNRSPVAKVAIAFSSRNRLRTGLTVAMYAVVVYIITLISIIPYSQEKMLEKSRNDVFVGFDGTVFPAGMQSRLPSETELLALHGIDDVAVLESAFLKIRSPSGRVLTIPAYILDEGFSENTVHRNITLWEGVSDLAQARQNPWEYLIAQDNAIIVSGALLSDLFPGDYVELILPARTDFSAMQTVFSGRGEVSDEDVSLGYFRVIGQIPETSFSFFNGVFIPKGVIDSDLLAGSYVDSTMLLRTSNDVSLSETRREVANISRRTNSLAFFVDDVIDLINATVKGIVDILRSFLYFGMVVGIVGIAIVMFKALYERKRLVGMMKAIGFTRRMVFTSFLLETSFIVILGLALGFITGTLTTYEMFSSPAFQGFELSVPWNQFLLMGLTFYIISVLSTLIPSYIASRLSPAEALRYFE